MATFCFMCNRVLTEPFSTTLFNITMALISCSNVTVKNHPMHVPLDPVSDERTPKFKGYLPVSKKKRH